MRFYKGMLSVLNWIHEDALEFYLTSYQGHRFPGGKTHMERNHRVAEAVCMFLRAGVETRPYMLPKLQNKYRTDMVGDDPAFYLSRELKKLERKKKRKPCSQESSEPCLQEESVMRSTIPVML